MHLPDTFCPLRLGQSGIQVALPGIALVSKKANNSIFALTPLRYRRQSPGRIILLNVLRSLRQSKTVATHDIHFAVR